MLKKLTLVVLGVRLKYSSIYYAAFRRANDQTGTDRR